MIRINWNIIETNNCNYFSTKLGFISVLIFSMPAKSYSSSNFFFFWLLSYYGGKLITLVFVVLPTSGTVGRAQSGRACRPKKGNKVGSYGQLGGQCTEFRGSPIARSLQFVLGREVDACEISLAGPGWLIVVKSFVHKVQRILLWWFRFNLTTRRACFDSNNSSDDFIIFGPIYWRV